MAPNAVVKLLGRVVPTMDVCCRLGLLLRFLRWPFPLDVSSLAFGWLVGPMAVDDDWDKRLGMTTNDCGTFLHAVKALWQREAPSNHRQLQCLDHTISSTWTFLFLLHIFFSLHSFWLQLIFYVIYSQVGVICWAFLFRFCTYG